MAAEDEADLLIDSLVYDPKADRWDTGPDLPAHTPVQGFGCAAVSLLGTIFFTAADGVVFRLNAAGTPVRLIALRLLAPALPAAFAAALRGVRRDARL